MQERHKANNWEIDTTFFIFLIIEKSLHHNKEIAATTNSSIFQFSIPSLF